MFVGPRGEVTPVVASAVAEKVGAVIGGEAAVLVDGSPSGGIGGVMNGSLVVGPVGIGGVMNGFPSVVVERVTGPAVVTPPGWLRVLRLVSSEPPDWVVCVEELIRNVD